MPEFKKKTIQNPYKKILIVAGAVVILIVVAALVVANTKVYHRKKELQEKLEDLQQKVDDLKNQNSELKEGTARANDDAYVEKVAREELDLQKPGEKVFSFVKSQGQFVEVAAVEQTSWTAWLANTWGSLFGKK